MATSYRERRSAVLPAVAWSSTAGSVVTVLPDGGMDLIWDGEALLVAGPDTRAHVARRRTPAELAGLRFDPGVAPSFLGLPAGALTDQRVAVHELWGRSTHDKWAERLRTAHSPTEELTALVVARWPSRGDVPSWVRPAVALLAAGARVGDVADRLGYSNRQLVRLAVDRFGYGPKVLGRILRFQRALPALRAGVDVTRVAHTTGFADASHLYRDVRALTGGSVAELRRPQPSSGA